MKHVWKIAALLLVCVLLAGCTATELTSGTTKHPLSNGEEEVEWPKVNIDTTKTYYADIDIKDHGTITVKLEPAHAPVTVDNFINLAQGGFYDGLTFHRIMEDFMMQGGDPEGDGTGGSDKEIVGEFTSNGWNNPLNHTRGAISMARSSAPNSASSQFFIVHQTSDHLDGDYAVFGYVTEGMDIVDTICKEAEPIDWNGTIAAADQPVINSIKIRIE